MITALRRHSPLAPVAVTCGLLFSVLLSAVSCGAFTDAASDEAALRSLRELSRRGSLPPESVVADVERRFAGSKTGDLAKLMRARIRLEANDFVGAASMLESPSLDRLDKLKDYILWLRGRAFQGSGNHAEAMNAYALLIQSHGDSLRAADAKMRWAESAIEVGRAAEVPGYLEEFVRNGNPTAMYAVAKAHQRLGDTAKAVELLRKIYYFNAGSPEAKKAEDMLATLSRTSLPETPVEMRARAEGLLSVGDFQGAETCYSELAQTHPLSVDNQVSLGKLRAFVGLKKMPEAQAVFEALANDAPEKEGAYQSLIGGYAAARSWARARTLLREFATAFPKSPALPKAFVDTGLAARDAKNKIEEATFLREALARFPEAIEVASAQFELAWLEHESGNFDRSWKMLVEHLARYSAKDSSFRGRSGYWAARDAQRAGKTDEACALYDALVYRYSTNWYGYLGKQRLDELKKSGACLNIKDFSGDPMMSGAMNSLRSIFVAPEKTTDSDLRRLEKASDLGLIGLFDWSLSELQVAQGSAGASPKVSLAVARHYRFRGDNVSALVALAKTYPDFAQMFPEEMGREEWEIFYPLTHWKEISFWAKERGLDPYKVAGLIRQESVFDPRARSSANAYGLMQILLPTARQVARKYNPSLANLSIEQLYNPVVSIELGTAYMKDQLEKYGRVEYMAAAYNAGPGRVVTWRSTLPAEMDEFVEAIPFRETRMYVQGVIRNTAQYRKLYDENGDFKPNVGAKVGGRQRVLSKD